MTLKQAADRCLELLHTGRPQKAIPLIAEVHALLLREVPPNAEVERFAWRTVCAHCEHARSKRGYRPIERLTVLRRAGFGEAGYALLIDTLERCAIASEAVEWVCTDLREWLLAARCEALIDDAAARLPELAAALAIQVFFGEYVLPDSPGEVAAVDALELDLRAAIAAGRSPLSFDLAIYAAYRPLHRLPRAERLPALVGAPADSLLGELVRCQIVEPLEEAALRQRIPVLTVIADGTSQAVRAQYEENPYPRWRWLTGVPAGGGASAPVGNAHPTERVLIAGCGTGRHPVTVAREHPGSSILAIDLSLASLAYAARKTREYGLLNVEFAQADLLRLPETGMTFDAITSVGVVHHMERPVEGLDALRRLMAHDQGLKVAVYTESGRQGYVAAMRLRAELGIAPSPEGIRMFRQMILSLADDNPARQVAHTADFYSASGCRDLVFHVMEHRFTIPAFIELAACAGLQVESLQVGKDVRARFAEQFPDPAARTDMEAWDRFERTHPGVFGSMYRFILTKG